MIRDDTVRSFSLGKKGEEYWRQLWATYRLARKSGEIILVASDSRDVRAEVRRRLSSIAPRVEVVEPGEGVTLAVHACAKASGPNEKIPAVWIEAPVGAPEPHEDMQWIEALVLLNQTRDALQMHGPCHVVLAGPRALHPVVVRRAPDLSSFMRLVLLFGDTLDELRDAPESLTWMHLSDLHVGGEDWQRDQVLDALVRDLPGLLERGSLRPELLFVTGDVANRGRRVEYDGAFVFLEKVTDVLGLERTEHVFLVPGNHDVDRSKIGRMVQRDHASLVGLSADQLREDVGELLANGEEFIHYGKRLTQWCEFTERFSGRARSVGPDRPWRSDVVIVKGLEIGVLSLCTAWASGHGDAKGQLILGERQLHELLAEVRDGGARLTIALMHHPLHWLHDGEYSAIRGRLEREVDLVLHGHVHDAHSEVRSAAGSSHAVLGAGAAYAGLGQERYHGFSVGKLDFGAERLEVHHFTWSTRSGRWHIDTGAPGADESGRVALSLSPAGLGAAQPRDGGHEVLATRLRRAAERVYSTFDFAGLGAGGPRKHVTLDQIFVPLQLAERGAEGQVVSSMADRVHPSEGRHTDDEFDAAERPRYVELDGLEARLSSASGGHVVVLGDPGSGKSTLTRYLACTIARREGGVVPLLLTVREWVAGGKHEGLLEMAARQATGVLQVRTNAGALAQLCQHGRVLLLIDGIDEVADTASRRDLRDRVHAFVANYPGVPVLATSRIAGYYEAPLDHGFDELSLEPFDDEAVEGFVHRWYDMFEDNPSERLRRRVSLLHALEVEPRVKAMARNPLLATLIAMVHFSRAQLPGERAKLYGVIIELLLITWPAQRGRAFPELHGSVQQAMLEKLALRLQERRAGSGARAQEAGLLVGRQELQEMLAELLHDRLPDRDGPERTHLARTWCDWLIEDSGLLQEEQPDRLGFLHLSLLEYMAGRSLVTRHLKDGYRAVAEMVAERHDDAVWQETLLLMLGSESKNRELGQAVVERLLATEGEAAPRWSACLFGLAMLRDEIDVGDQRFELLESVCRAALTVDRTTDWYKVSSRVGAIVRYSQVYGQYIRDWIQNEIEEVEAGQLPGRLAVAVGAIPWGDVEARLKKRADQAEVILALLPLGFEHDAGCWAREHAGSDIWVEWIRSTPMIGIMVRSLELLDPKRVQVIDPVGHWIRALLFRAGLLAEVVFALGRMSSSSDGKDSHVRLPLDTYWSAGEDSVFRCKSAPALAGVRGGVQLAGCRSLVFARAYEEAVAFTSAVMSVPDPGGGPLEQMAEYGGRKDTSLLILVQLFSLSFTRHHGSWWGHLVDDSHAGEGMLARALGQLISKPVLIIFRDVLKMGSFEMGSFEVDSSERSRESSLSCLESPVKAWRRLLDMKEVDDEFVQGVKNMLAVMTGEVYAGLALAGSGGDVEVVSNAGALATVRLQNRWLNIFFTPLVEYSTKSRPLCDYPDLHALLLTYGLAQYQTTWEWPDCPHWHSWFSGDPPGHWLPAHVWHLVRSIQEPEEPGHRERAMECLDRSDRPELAQELRDNTVAPVSPEFLALFDHGDPPAEQSSD